MRLSSLAVLSILCCLVPGAAYSVAHCRGCTSTARRRASAGLPLRRLATMSAASEEPEQDPESMPDITPIDRSDRAELADVAPLPWQRDLETLAERIVSLKNEEQLSKRFEALPSAWVLVFDAETDDEAVYSMQIDSNDDDDDAHVVLAFEEKADAERYALTLTDEPYEEPPTVQQLDFEALVVTSRDADFGVAIVFAGDLGNLPSVDDREIPIFASDAAAALSVSITMVPGDLFEGKSASDYIDPAEDPIWVLVHDAGTADAQYFSMVLNGSDSIVCFRDEEAAARCGEALQATGNVRGPETQSVLLEDLLSSLSEERDVCLVDEVVEHMFESDDDSEATLIEASDENMEVVGSVGASRSTVTPSSVLKALERQFNATSTEDGDPDGTR